MMGGEGRWDQTDTNLYEEIISTAAVSRASVTCQC